MEVVEVVVYLASPLIGGLADELSRRPQYLQLQSVACSYILSYGLAVAISSAAPAPMQWAFQARLRGPRGGRASCQGGSAASGVAMLTGRSILSHPTRRQLALHRTQKAGGCFHP